MGHYVIARQSDGSATLAHAQAGFRPRTERAGHKYILRLFTPTGTRYIYTLAELRAYYKEKTQQAKKAVNTAAKAVGDSITKAASGIKLNNSRKKEEPKQVAESARSRPESRKRNVTGNADPIEKKPVEEESSKPNRPQGRTRNVTGKADPIEKRAVEDREEPEERGGISIAGTKSERIDNMNEQIRNINSIIKDQNDPDRKQKLGQGLTNLMEYSAASYVVASTQCQGTDQKQKEMYQSIQSELDKISGNQELSDRNRKYASEVSRDLKERQEYMDEYNRLCDEAFNNHEEIPKKAKDLQKKIERKDKEIISSVVRLQKEESNWSTDSIISELDEYNDLSEIAMSDRDEMNICISVLSAASAMFNERGYTQDDYLQNSQIRR